MALTGSSFYLIMALIMVTVAKR